MVLVGIVVLVFLQDWRAMILPMIDVPVSLDRHLRGHGGAGLQPEQPTLFGLVLAIGIVVDDAIVVLENIERHDRQGLRRADGDDQGHGGDHRPDPGDHAWCSARCSCRAASSAGITGQFFRQFAVTIAVSTIISAVNALTMTPSRAVLIFKTEDGAGTATSSSARRLPWWIFGVLGGLLDRLATGRATWPVRFGLPGGLAAAAAEAVRLAVLGHRPPPISLPARWSAGWSAGSIIRPVNAVLGWLFRGFNRLFDRMTGVYGWTVGKLLRLSVLVLLVYGACWC